jgi:hypothetical protein
MNRLQKKSERAKPQKRGPKPDTVKIDENWKEAVKKSLKKKKPKEGWPK